MAEASDANSTMQLLRTASGSSVQKWSFGDMAAPVAKVALGAGLVMALGSWWADSMFKDDETGDDEEGAWWKRAAFKGVVGVIGFLVLRKFSLAVAVGALLGGVGMAAYDLLVNPDGADLNAKLDDWFGDDEEEETAGSSSRSGGSSGSGTSGGSSAGRIADNRVMWS